MARQNNLLVVFSFLCLALLLVDCTSTKGLADQGFISRTEEEVKAALVAHNQTFDRFNAKGSIDANTPTFEGGASVQIRQKSDSLTWILVKKLGVEVARILVDSNEMTSIHRLEGSYSIQSFRDLSRFVGTTVTLEDLQQLLIGNVPLPSPEAKQIVTADTLHHHYHIQSTIDQRAVSYDLSDKHLTLKQMSLTTPKVDVAIQFEAYGTIKNAKNMAAKRHLTINNKQTNETYSFVLEIDDVDTESKSFTFKIPDHYERI